MKHLIVCLLVAFGLYACHSPKSKKPAAEEAAVSEVIYKPRFARGFSIERNNGAKYLKIVNPWQFASDVGFNYKLSPNADPALPNEIQLPVQRAICMSTTHVAFLETLGQASTIYGMSGVKLVYSSSVKDIFDLNKVIDVGYDSNLSYELIYSLRPDVIFAYGIQGEFTTVEEKLNELGVKVVYIGDYIEETPLGKAEWLVAMAAFFDMESQAESQFDSICANYTKAQRIAAQVSERPSVMLNVPFKDVWYLPGGKGNMAKFIEDAGGNYLLSDNNQRESYPMSIEQAYAVAQDADYWLIGDLSNSLKELEQVDKRLAAIPAFKNGRVYDNNARLSPYGGNDIWESGIVHPHIILNDLIKIFHPQLLPDYELFYYKQLK